MATESEIKQVWRDNLLGAASDCDLLAKLPARGVIYRRMVGRLKLAEGAARQMCTWREDSRWLPVAYCIEQLHEMAGQMIRKHAPGPWFLGVAVELRKTIAALDLLENAAVGKLGMILPKPQPLIREAGERLIQVTKPEPSLILPA